jgi:hypothetical protein
MQRRAFPRRSSSDTISPPQNDRHTACRRDKRFRASEAPRNSSCKVPVYEGPLSVWVHLL